MAARAGASALGLGNRDGGAAAGPGVGAGGTPRGRGANQNPGAVSGPSRPQAACAEWCDCPSTPRRNLRPIAPTARIMMSWRLGVSDGRCSRGRFLQLSSRDTTRPSLWACGQSRGKMRQPHNPPAGALCGGGPAPAFRRDGYATCCALPTDASARTSRLYLSSALRSCRSCDMDPTRNVVTP